MLKSYFVGHKKKKNSEIFAPGIKTRARLGGYEN